MEDIPTSALHVLSRQIPAHDTASVKIYEKAYRWMLVFDSKFTPKWVRNITLLQIDRAVFSKGITKSCFKMRDVTHSDVPFVVKFGVHSYLSRNNFFTIAIVQSIGAQFAETFNSAGNFPVKLKFQQLYVLELVERMHTNNVCNAEPLIEGEYKEHDVSADTNDPEFKVFQAFIHFVMVKTNHEFCLSHFRIVQNVVTSAIIHTRSGKGFTEQNAGQPEFLGFAESHKCNEFCHQLKLAPINVEKIKEAPVVPRLLNGTAVRRTVAAAVAEKVVSQGKDAVSFVSQKRAVFSNNEHHPVPSSPSPIPGAERDASASPVPHDILSSSPSSNMPPPPSPHLASGYLAAIAPIVTPPTPRRFGGSVTPKSPQLGNIPKTGEVKLEPKLDHKTEPKTEPKAESKITETVESKSEPKPEPKNEPKQEPKVEPKKEVKPEPKQELKHEPKHDSKQDLKQDLKAKPKPDPKTDLKPAESKPEPKKPESDQKSEPKSEPKVEAKSEPKVEAKLEPKVEAKKIEIKAEPKQEVKSPNLQSKSEPLKPEVKAEPKVAAKQSTTIVLSTASTTKTSDNVVLSPRTQPAPASPAPASPVQVPVQSPLLNDKSPLDLQKIFTAISQPLETIPFLPEEDEVADPIDIIQFEPIPVDYTDEVDGEYDYSESEDEYEEEELKPLPPLPDKSPYPPNLRRHDHAYAKKSNRVTWFDLLDFEKNLLTVQQARKGGGEGLIITPEPARTQKAPKSWDLKSFRINTDAKGAQAECIVGDENPYLYTGSSEGYVAVWDVEGLKVSTSFKTHSKAVKSLVLRDTVLYTGSTDTNIASWDINHKKSINKTSSKSEINALAISVAHNLLFSAENDKTIKVWDLHSLQYLNTLNGHTRAVKALYVMGNYLFSGSNDQQVFVWNLSTQRVVKGLLGHEGWIRSIHAHGSTLFTGSQDETIRLWDLNSTECSQIIQAKGPVQSLVATPQCLFSAAGDYIEVWNNDYQNANVLNNRVPVLCMWNKDNQLFCGSIASSLKVWSWD